MKKNIILIGGGGHCKSCIDVIEQEKKFKIIGYVDLKNNGKIFNYKYLGNEKKLKDLRAISQYALITVGQIKSSSTRKKIYRKLKYYKFKIPKIISPFAYVSKHSKISEGSIVMHNSLINSGAIIGKNCIINSGAIIEHDAIIGDNVHVSTNACVNGNSLIGQNSFIGSGSVIKENKKVKKDSIIRANSFIK